MTEYINKTTAYEVLKKMEEEHNLSFSKEAYNKAAIMISTMPTEDVQPVVHAKWFLDGNSSSEEEKCYRCSNCKAVLEEDYKWHNHNYCYHCGAKMDEKEATYIKDIFMTR